MRVNADRLSSFKRDLSFYAIWECVQNVQFTGFSKDVGENKNKF